MVRDRAAAPPRRRRSPPSRAGRPAARATSAPGSMSCRAAGVDQQRGRLHPRQVRRGDDAAGLIDQPHVQRDDVALLVERVLARRDVVTVGLRARRATVPAPRPAPSSRTPCHSRRPCCRFVRSRGCRASCRAACGRPRSASARLERAHLLRNLSHGGQDQPPGQFRRGIGRRVGMLVRRHDHAAPCARVDVDVRVHAALADQSAACRDARAAALGSAVRSRIRTSTSVSLRRSASASVSWTWSVPDCRPDAPSSFRKQERVLSVSK